MIGGYGLFNSVLLGVLVALALKRKNEEDPLGHWRWIAGCVGAVFPFTEIMLYFVGPGALAQGMRGLTWSLILMPFYAVGLAGILGTFARKSWDELLPPVVGGLASAWMLALLSEPGIFPLALLVDWRVGLAVLHAFDVVLFGLCLVGVGMAYFLKQFDRDLARLTLMCVLGYVLMAGYWSWDANRFGERYAASLNISHAVVRVLPQALSPLNWRVIVSEPNGKLHDTRITLGRSGGHGGSRATTASDDPYKPMDAAIWRVYRRYGNENVAEDIQRQVRLAWYGWQANVYGWLGRYSVFERIYAPQEVGVNQSCVGFRDIRAEGEKAILRGTYVVCPARLGVRVFQPAGNGMMRELVPYEGVR